MCDATQVDGDEGVQVWMQNMKDFFERLESRRRDFKEALPEPESSTERRQREHEEQLSEELRRDEGEKEETSRGQTRGSVEEEEEEEEEEEDSENVKTLGNGPQEPESLHFVEDEEFVVSSRMSQHFGMEEDEDEDGGPVGGHSRVSLFSESWDSDGDMGMLGGAMEEDTEVPLDFAGVDSEDGVGGMEDASPSTTPGKGNRSSKKRKKRKQVKKMD